MSLVIWTIYRSPVDMPGRYVARKWVMDHPTRDVLQHKTLAGLREQLPVGLTRIGRQPSDDPKIVEVWL